MTIGLACTAFAALLAPAAVAPPPPPPAAMPSTVQGVTVTAQPQGFHSDIDRRSYSVAKDLQATSGSLADVLRNVPSVQVDVEGNLTLRGDPDVTIMIDGKPSALFKGAGRAAALQQLPASQIDRIEVLTNPSAASNPEGAAGIINIVTKPARKPGYSGSARAGAGTRGRYSFGANGAYNAPRLTVTGDLAHMSIPDRFKSVAQRQEPALVSDYRLLLHGSDQSWTSHLNADYDLTPKTRLSAEAQGLWYRAGQTGLEQLRGTDPTGGPDTAYDRDLARSHFALDDTEASATLRHRFAGDDHDLVLNLSQERGVYAFHRPDHLFQLAPIPGDQFETSYVEEILTPTIAKADYQRPLTGGQFKAGYELDVDHNIYRNLVARGPSPDALVADPGFTDTFGYRQAINAVYATYQKAFGDLTVLAGLRLETVGLRLAEGESGAVDRRRYGRAYPSLHLSYPLDDTRKLTAGYSRRVKRPNPDFLNPFRQYGGPLAYYQGDPNLKPQDTDALETAYEYRNGSTYRLATLFWRVDHDPVEDVVHDLGAGVLVTRHENVGENRSGGLELATNAKLTRALSYSLSATGSWSRLDAAGLAVPATRSGFALAGQASLDWQASPADIFQLNTTLRGRQLTPQGHNQPAFALNLGYQRKLTPTLAATVTVQNALNTLHTAVIIDTPGLRERINRRGNGTVMNLGLAYTFGGQGKGSSKPAFDYGAGS